MADLLPIEGLTVKFTRTGDIQIVIHLEDLKAALANVPTLDNKTHSLIALRRLTPSAKGHTHDKPVSIAHTYGKKA